VIVLLVASVGQLTHQVTDSAGELVEWTTMNLTVTDEAGEAVEFADAPTMDEDDITAVVIDGTELPSATMAWRRFKAVWSGEYGSPAQTFADVKFFEVVPYPVSGVIGVSEASIYTENAGMESGSVDRYAMAEVVAEVSRVIRTLSLHDLRHGVQTETRNKRLFGKKNVYLQECYSVDTVEDVEGTDLSFTVVPGERGSDHISHVELAEEFTGTVVVTGTFGWHEIPDDVKHVAKVTARVWYLKELATQVSVFDTATGYIERPETLPRHVKGIIDSLRDRLTL
jgi:hypothetical protein